MSEQGLHMCSVLSRHTSNNDLSKIITVDEAWGFQYHPENKRQNLQLKQPKSLSSISRVMSTLHYFTRPKSQPSLLCGNIEAIT